MSAKPADEQFAVLRFSAEWRVLRNGQDNGHFDYRVDAVDAALRYAKRAHEAGKVTEVLVQDTAGQFDRMALLGNPSHPA